MVQASQRFDEHIAPLISVLVPPSSEKVKSIVRVEIVVAVEMPSYKVMDLLLRLLMEILELVHGRELDDIQSVRKDSIRLALE